MELEIKNITKKFGDKIAVDNVNLKLTPGVWGLLGANGAEKTTLIRMIAGILKPSNGEIYFNNQEICSLGKDYRNAFGFLPQDFGCSRDFTVKDYLEYVAALKGIAVSKTKSRIDELLDIFTLSDVKKKKIVKLTGRKWNGKFIGYDTHQELIAKCAVYNEMYTKEIEKKQI